MDNTETHSQHWTQRQNEDKQNKIHIAWTLTPTYILADIVFVRPSVGFEHI